MATGNDVREIFQLAKPSEHAVRVRKVEKKPGNISLATAQEKNPPKQ